MPSDLSTLDLATLNAAQGVIVAAFATSAASGNRNPLMLLQTVAYPVP